MNYCNPCVTSIKSRPAIIDVNEVISAACFATRRSVERIKRRDRERNIIIARQLITLFLHTHGYKDKEIAALLNRDRTTILSARRVAKNFVQVKDPLFLSYLEQFEYELKWTKDGPDKDEKKHLHDYGE